MAAGKTAPLIALLTDFGTQDPFAGIMKGVVARTAPGIPLVDLNHAIPPGDILRAALNLWQAVPFFPNGTVFLCVVDPGVGTSRQPVIVDTPAARFIGPDNGLFSFVLRGEYQAFRLENPNFTLPEPSSTFHGRDIFAPCAAHAALGIPGPLFGGKQARLVQLPTPRLGWTANRLEGEILYADRFGNLLTSLGLFRPEKSSWIFNPWVGELPSRPVGMEKILLHDGRMLPLVRTFGEIPAGECAGLVGSTGLIEIAARGASAKKILELDRATIIHLIERRPS